MAILAIHAAFLYDHVGQVSLVLIFQDSRHLENGTGIFGDQWDKASQVNKHENICDWTDEGENNWNLSSNIFFV